MMSTEARDESPAHKEQKMRHKWAMMDGDHSCGRVISIHASEKLAYEAAKKALKKYDRMHSYVMIERGEKCAKGMLYRVGCFPQFI